MPRLVQQVDEEAEIIRAAEALSGGEITGGLVAPGIVQRVLGNRQQFDVGKAQVDAT